MNAVMFVSLHNKPPYRGTLERLAGEGMEFIGTKGTAGWCAEQGIPCRSISEVLSFEPRLGGQVKTLHPDLYQALLSEEGDGILGGELAGVIVDLTPLRSGTELNRRAVDIGGVSLLRAAAKNYPKRVPLATPEMTEEFLELRPLDEEQRIRFARRALEQTLLYDLHWRKLLRGDTEEGWSLGLDPDRPLRYGENPHQQAYLMRGLGRAVVDEYELIGDKELSYTNCLDLEAARGLVAREDPVTAVVIKHTNPTGWACGEHAPEVVEQAWDGDPKSAFGGVVGINRSLTPSVLDVLEDYFLDRILVPDVSPEARQRLEAEGSPQVAVWNGDWTERSGTHLRSWEGSYLTQETMEVHSSPDQWDAVTNDVPAKPLKRALVQAWTVVAAASSNAAVVARPDQVLGVGAGQQSRVDAVRLACEKAVEHHGDLPEDAVLASDGFFPFADNVEVAARYGVRALVQPGGSVKDDEVIREANDHGLSMMFTGQRVFRH